MADEVKEKVVDSATVPTIYADGIHGMELRDGVAVINLSRHVFPAPNSDLGEPFHQIVQRLAIPAASFVRFADWFSDAKEKIVESGAIVIQVEDGKDA